MEVASPSTENDALGKSGPWGLIGHEAAIRELDRGLRAGRLSHAYLITGPTHVGKMALSIRLAQAVNCHAPEDVPCLQCSSCRRIGLGQHPDILVVEPGATDEGRARRDIGIDDVRALQHTATLNPYEANSRVFIVNGAELLSEEASNSLLKLLEEPPPRSLLLLLTSGADGLLSTIRSRCRRLDLRPASLSDIATLLEEQEEMPADEAQKVARLSLGCPGWAIAAAQDPSILDERTEEAGRILQLVQGGMEQRFAYSGELAGIFFRERDAAKEQLYLWLRWWRDLLLVKEGASQYAADSDYLTQQQQLAERLSTAQIVGFLQTMDRTIDALDANANARIALDVMMLKLPVPPSAATTATDSEESDVDPRWGRARG